MPETDCFSTGPIVPLVYTRQELAQALSIGTTTLDRLRASGRLPSPIIYQEPGRGSCSLYWSRKAIADWVEDGCPNVAEWERRRRER